MFASCNLRKLLDIKLFRIQNFDRQFNAVAASLQGSNADKATLLVHISIVTQNADALT